MVRKTNGGVGGGGGWRTHHHVRERGEERGEDVHVGNVVVGHVQADDPRRVRHDQLPHMHRVRVPQPAAVRVGGGG
jgi:hypothetical protein